ncbi:MAG: DNA polymerase III subunit gamma/tau, partial [Flavobacteriales bacterium]|nr:DNA polymerase III subunit gamma/tau [Flavobacteriales bacterium]
PKHAIFILATTEKHKIIPTILSRCQIFDFKSIQVNDIISHLEFVAKSEGIETEKDALHIVAQKSGGSLRDSLSMFDRLVDSTNLTLTYKSVIENLNILDHDYYLKITNQIISNDISNVMLTFNEILMNGFDAHQFIMGLASHFRDLLVSKDPQTIVLLDKGEELKTKYLEQSANCDLSFLIKALRMCNKCDVEYRASKNQRLLIELTLLKMSTIGQLDSEKKNEIQQIAIPKKKIENKTEESSEINTPRIEDKKDEVKVVSEDITINKEEKQEEKSKDSEPPKKKIRKNRISLTEMMEDKKEDKIDLISSKRSKSFSLEKMQEVWSSFTNKIKEDGKTNLFVTLSSFDPIIIAETVIIKISNDTQEKIIEENKLELMEYLRNNLENDKIEIKLEYTEEIKSNIPYTAKDKFEKMKEENPSLNILQQKLGLDPEY